MPQAATRRMMNRAMNDESFLDHFRANPESVLEDFDLNEDERDALMSRDDDEVRDVLGDARASTNVVVVLIF